MARNVAKETFWRGKMDEYEKRGPREKGSLTESPFG